MTPYYVSLYYIKLYYIIYYTRPDYCIFLVVYKYMYWFYIIPMYYIFFVYINICINVLYNFGCILYQPIYVVGSLTKNHGCLRNVCSEIGRGLLVLMGIEQGVARRGDSRESQGTAGGTWCSSSDFYGYIYIHKVYIHI